MMGEAFFLFDRVGGADRFYRSNGCYGLFVDLYIN